MKPKFSQEVEDHSNWCLQRMLGKAAENLGLPAESVAVYIANEQRVRNIMKENRRAK